MEFGTPVFGRPCNRSSVDIVETLHGGEAGSRAVARTSKQILCVCDCFSYCSLFLACVIAFYF